MKFGLLGLCLLLSSIFVIKFVNAADDITPMYIDLSNTVLHNSRLHTLRLGSDAVVGTLKVVDSKAKISNGLVVGDSQTTHNVGISTKVVIGGGKSNTVTQDYAGIGGGGFNAAKGSYAVVGGGSGNEAQGQHSAIVGGQGNSTVTEALNSVVVGGQRNIAQDKNSVVIGGNNNQARQDSLALGKNAKGAIGSFAWNGNGEAYHGVINARSGILVGTTTPIEGVNLVVGGGVQVAGDNDNVNKATGEVRYVGGCFYAYDGDKWHVMNRGNEKDENDNRTDNDKCSAFLGDSVARYCEFGNTVVWNNDVVVAYSQSYTTGNCNTYKQDLVCQNGHLVTSAGAIADNYYPYCYKISS